ncbi:hypothetical protein HZB04_02335 [Candidatus Wolfebacteria bacterium]|nr:hypothetical protein [Candidatus Wolfebacteria bacterium]
MKKFNIVVCDNGSKETLKKTARTEKDEEEIYNWIQRRSKSSVIAFSITSGDRKQRPDTRHSNSIIHRKRMSLFSGAGHGNGLRR